MVFSLVSLAFCCILSLAPFAVNADPMMDEFRAVWIATVANIDWPSSNTVPPAQQKQELINILNTVQRLNMNVVVFHVREKDLSIDDQRRFLDDSRFDQLVMRFMRHH